MDQKTLEDWSESEAVGLISRHNGLPHESIRKVLGSTIRYIAEGIRIGYERGRSDAEREMAETQVESAQCGICGKIDALANMSQYNEPPWFRCKAGCHARWLG